MLDYQLTVPQLLESLCVQTPGSVGSEVANNFSVGDRTGRRSKAVHRIDQLRIVMFAQRNLFLQRTRFQVNAKSKHLDRLYGGLECCVSYSFKLFCDLFLRFGNLFDSGQPDFSVRVNR